MQFQRGGLLRLGAVLTATSAPLRTSPVKRGDWVLAPRAWDANSASSGRMPDRFPADDKLFGGLSRHSNGWKRTSAIRRARAATRASTRWASRWSNMIRWAGGEKNIPTASRFKTRARWRIKRRSLVLTDCCAICKSQEPQVLRTCRTSCWDMRLGRTVTGIRSAPDRASDRRPAAM